MPLSCRKDKKRWHKQESFFVTQKILKKENEYTPTFLYPYGICDGSLINILKSGDPWKTLIKI